MSESSRKVVKGTTLTCAVLVWNGVFNSHVARNLTSRSPRYTDLGRVCKQSSPRLTVPMYMDRRAIIDGHSPQESGRASGEGGLWQNPVASSLVPGVPPCLSSLTSGLKKLAPSRAQSHGDEGGY